MLIYLWKVRKARNKKQIGGFLIMSNMKNKISLSVMLLVLLMSVGSVFAAAKTVYVPVYMSVTDENGTELKSSTTYTHIKPGDKISITAYCDHEKSLYWSENSFFMDEYGYKKNDKGMALLSYYFDKNESAMVDTDDPTEAEITIPNLKPGVEHILSIEGVGAVDSWTDEEKNIYYLAKTGWLNIHFVISDEEEPETISASIAESSETTLKIDAKVENGEFSKFVYNWDNEASKEATTKPLTITIPNFEQKDVETKHTLTVKAYTKNGKVATSTYVVTIPAKQPTTPVLPETPIDDELVVEPWMKEDNNMKELAVSLRNDSDEYEKGNKNFYALGEEIVYYVDYKNGGDDITREVKLVLELPLDFKVIDAFGGIVDAENRTITWSFPEGLEEDQAGTKVVKVAYTGFERASKKYEIVYPVADIYERNKVVDSSAVINYIFKDEDTEITDEHYPYMFGDAGKDTFRPDSTITRAEGALVLTRIFGIDTSGTKVESLYPDLDQTYVEAQKAIVAATKLGLINGYTDGTYRPNNKMTKAEFMKIIASYIEANAEDEDIRGLEVKEDTNIKIYKNPKNVYVTGTTTVSQHWASDWVTMLVRLNMTPVSSSDKNLGLDEEITRAEVAQLVNFYLLRAPADVDSSTKTQFSDVSKRHDLFEDIVEATRGEHTYTLTQEGYEVSVEEED